MTCAPRLLLIGWDAADWQVIDPLLEAGQLPHLASLLQRGVRGNLATVQPIISPMLWTTIATGRRAYEHGIAGFVEPQPDGSGLRPVASTSRRCRALWNMLTLRQRRSIVVNWFATHPAEHVAGTVVSDLFFHPGEHDDDDAPNDAPNAAPPGAVHPAELSDELAALRIVPSEILASDLLPFIPSLGDIDLREDPRPAQLARLLAHTSSVHAVATHLLQRESWDFAAVYYSMIDHVDHTFMPYHPPQLAGVSDVDFDRYRHVVTATYRFHDMLLGTLSALAGPDTTLLLVSDHGFESGGLRQGLDAWASPENWHRRYGIAVLAGPRVRPGAALYGASLLDVAPSTLALLGLPVGADLEGRVWGEVLDADFEWETLPSWEQVAGDDGRLSPEAGEDPWDAAAVVRQFVELGYVEDPGPDAQAAIRNAERENQVLLARSLVAGRQFARAAEVWASLSAEHPDDVRYVLQLARCRLAAGQLDEGRALVERHAPAALQAGHAATLAELALLAGSADQALAYLAAAPDDADATRRVQFAYCRGRAYQQLKRYPEAIAQYRDVLGLQPEHARAHFGLASCALASQDFVQAAELALQAIDLQYWQPQAHLCLGQALVGLARYDDAIAALQVALCMAPQLQQAHYWLAEAFERGPGDMGRAAQHRSLFRSST